MAVFTRIQFVSQGCGAILAAVLLGGCASPSVNPRVTDPTWDRFVTLVRQLEWSTADRGAACESAQKLLGLEQYSPMELQGHLVVAHGDRHKAKLFPAPYVWGADAQRLVCAGDLFGDGRTEYVFACGWSGPMGGVICIYDDSLRKIRDERVDGDVFGVELADLLGDRKLELLCWQDHHHGTDGWVRDLTIYKPAPAGEMREVWSDYTYAEGTATARKKIQLHRVRGWPAVIEARETSTSPPTTTWYEWNPQLGKFQPQEIGPQ
jgi:hypothetical protein